LSMRAIARVLKPLCLRLYLNPFLKTQLSNDLTMQTFSPQNVALLLGARPDTLAQDGIHDGLDYTELRSDQSRYAPVMAKQARKARQRMAGFRAALELQFTCVASALCSKRAALKYLQQDNCVSAQVPTKSSFRRQIEIVAAHASQPIPIASLDSELDRYHLQMGNTLFGHVGSYFDSVADTLGMWWWMDDNGLTIGYPELRPAAPGFVTTAGQLMVGNFKNGRLSDEAFGIIAKALDEAGFQLLENLVPAQRKKVAEHNTKHPKNAIKTFQQAARHARVGRRALQLTLYAARVKHLKRHG